MRFPLHITVDTLAHQARQAFLGNRRYPYVLMLEPLYACNLACLGCTPERHTGKIADRLTLEQCLKAVDECGAPGVSLCGGEPTLYPELKDLVTEVIRRRRHICLCTNALLLDEKVFGVIPPHKRLTLNIHLDGMRRTHDRVCAREGVFEKAVAMIREAKRLGYHVMTNTTVFKETETSEVKALCELTKSLGVDGMLVAPGYHYETIQRDMFLTRAEIQKKFRRILGFSRHYRLTSTPLFLEFAAGIRDLPCSPWSTVTYTVRGWKGPCYLIAQKYTHSWKEFWEETDWDYWESRQDSRCANCAMHSGFEASAVREIGRSPKDLIRMAAWNLLG